MSSVTQTAPQASSPQMHIPMQEFGKKPTTSFEMMKKSVVAEFGEAKLKELASHKAAIQSLKQKNVAENWRTAGGVVAGIAVAALGVAGLVGAILICNAAVLSAVALVFILLAGVVSFYGGIIGGMGLICYIGSFIAGKNISNNTKEIQEHETKISKIYGYLKKVINKKTQNCDERNKLFQAVINHIQTKK